MNLKTLYANILISGALIASMVASTPSATAAKFLGNMIEHDPAARTLTLKGGKGKTQQVDYSKAHQVVLRKNGTLEDVPTDRPIAIMGKMADDEASFHVTQVWVGIKPLKGFSKTEMTPNRIDGYFVQDGTAYFAKVNDKTIPLKLKKNPRVIVNRRGEKSDIDKGADRVLAIGGLKGETLHAGQIYLFVSPKRWEPKKENNEAAD